MCAQTVLGYVKDSIEEDIAIAKRERDREYTWTRKWAVADGKLKTLRNVAARVAIWQSFVDGQIERSKTQDLITL